MFCPNCRVEYRPGVERCAECDTRLVEKLPPEPPEPFETVEVWAGSHKLLYDFLTNALRDAGIDVHPRGDQSTYLFGSPEGFGPPYSLWVHRDQGEAAREIIEECLKSFETESRTEAESDLPGPDTA